MKLKIIPETLFVRKINVEALSWRPDDLTYSVFFEFKNKRILVKDYRTTAKSYKRRSENELLEEESFTNFPVSGLVVIWPNKVQDPRGFVVTISNLDEIVANSVINRGVIEGDLWYAIDSDNRLALVSSETEKNLKEAVSSVSEIKVGDIVEKCYGRGYGIYLGKIKIRERDWDRLYSDTPKLATCRVVYDIESDSFDTYGLGVGAGTVVTGIADPDTVLELTDRFRSRLVTYACLEDDIDTIFTPDGSEKDYPSDMFDALLSECDNMYSRHYPFYRIIGPRKMLCLDLYPCGKDVNTQYITNRLKDGIYFQIHEKELTNYGTFQINYKNSEKEEERTRKYPGSWKELLKDQGWIYFGSEENRWKSDPDLMVKMKSGKTLMI